MNTRPEYRFRTEEPLKAESGSVNYAIAYNNAVRSYNAWQLQGFLTTLNEMTRARIIYAKQTIPTSYGELHTGLGEMLTHVEGYEAPQPTEDAIRAAVLAEREACAEHIDVAFAREGKEFAAAIRERKEHL